MTKFSSLSIHQIAHHCVRSGGKNEVGLLFVSNEGDGVCGAIEIDKDNEEDIIFRIEQARGSFERNSVGGLYFIREVMDAEQILNKICPLIKIEATSVPVYIASFDDKMFKITNYRDPVDVIQTYDNAIQDIITRRSLFSQADSFNDYSFEKTTALLNQGLLALNQLIEHKQTPETPEKTLSSDVDTPVENMSKVDKPTDISKLKEFIDILCKQT